MTENSTKIISRILSSLSSDLSFSTSSSTVHTGTTVNSMYVAGIAFMMGIFLLLLWVNLCSRYCQCWHDTSVVNMFHRRWLTRRSTTTNNNSSSTKSRQLQQQRLSKEDELE